MTAAVLVGAALLGSLGSVLRFELDGLVQRRRVGSFPFGTLTVNLVGSFVLGIVKGAGVGGDALLLGGTAFLGSFTTFSTWMLETERLAEDGDDGLAFANVAVPLAGGLALAVVGWAIGSLL